jgi:cytochrome c oxidase cbb3-type subunit III
MWFSKQDRRKQMVDRARNLMCNLFLQPTDRSYRFFTMALVAFGIFAGKQAGWLNTAAAQGSKPPDEYGELLARPEELAPVAVNDIVKSIRLNAAAMSLGRKVYDENCAACHGEDLKGIPAQHAPDLTDAEWRFSGDDLESGGAIKFPSDIEWTVRYGIRSENPNARGLEADMLAYDPQYRTKDDIEDYGNGRFLTDEEIGDVVEYVLEISGQPHDAAKAVRGGVLFQDGAKGNCYDCHGEDATGIDALGSTNLTRKELYLYGADRASILESITHGRHGVMPDFDGKLKPEEIKAVSVFTFSRAKK